MLGVVCLVLLGPVQFKPGSTPLGISLARWFGMAWMVCLDMSAEVYGFKMFLVVMELSHTHATTRAHPSFVKKLSILLNVTCVYVRLVLVTIEVCIVCVGVWNELIMISLCVVKG